VQNDSLKSVIRKKQEFFMRVIELEPKKTINGYTKYNLKKKYNFKALTVPDYLNVLPGFKK